MTTGPATPPQIIALTASVNEAKLKPPVGVNWSMV